ncbi:hypothetical protein [Erythrobacter crassostreae]|uniref:Uncharacterized protein n=1 Tax=Erythrobacter crassostreae TaxID=2828328 RepID=A0A9X1F3X5_9SPHN|nr:hypothetical protein [Erythrobacter crassostrea]MBV7259694.1 hypothetical protein [Erythrobacter crassostrea]
MGYFSFWWTMIPAFFAASFAVSNNDAQLSTVMRANEEGRLHVMPLFIASGMLTILAISGGAYWAARYFS